MSTYTKRYRRTQRWFRENPERRREYNARYYAKTAEKRREIARLKRLANPERTKQFNVQFRARNPNYMREYCARRKVINAWRKWNRHCGQGAGHG